MCWHLWALHLWAGEQILEPHLYAGVWSVVQGHAVVCEGCWWVCLRGAGELENITDVLLVEGGLWYRRKALGNHLLGVGLWAENGYEWRADAHGRCVDLSGMVLPLG